MRFELVSVELKNFEFLVLNTRELGNRELFDVFNALIAIESQLHQIRGVLLLVKIEQNRADAWLIQRFQIAHIELVDLAIRITRL